ncbi:MAG: hypothetical protein WD845_10475 [Pirellulales bacterium]
MSGRRLALSWLWLPLLAAALAAARPALAGGGPENVFLVVNSASWASQTVANHFIALRKLAPLNVFYVHWNEGFESADGEAFRAKILLPAIQTISRRGLASQIDYVVYSSDFPYAINFGPDFTGTRLIDQARPTCSINSATFLWNLVVLKNPLMMDFGINQYMRSTANRTVRVPTHGFRSWYGWGPGGEMLEAGGQPYLLSTMLGMTSGRGNSVNEVVAGLRRSAAADGTHPQGTIYYCQTKDVRSTTRAAEFPAAVAELKKLGVNAEIISTAMPVGRDDVLGLMSGVATFSWQETRSTILHGAICENFTSFGGILTEGQSQTPLTEFIRFGAAGSSGTVVEPYAIGAKFPSPFIHVHYARGCSLAEAFYQSIFAPAQQLIVGDPLCQPFANIPKVEFAGIPTDGNVKGKLAIAPTASVSGGAKIDRYELFVDGRRIDTTRVDGRLEWDSASESDGYHELRVVALDATPVETQGRAIVGVTVNNHGHTIQASASPTGSVRWDQTLKIHVTAPGMKELAVVHDTRVLKKIAGPEGNIEIDPRLFGLGPVMLQAVGTAGNSAAERVWSAPLAIAVEPAQPLPALASPPANRARGLVLQMPGNKVIRVDETKDPAWLTLKGLHANEPFVLQGFFDVEADDVYQFQLWHTGQLKLSVDGRTLIDDANGDNKQRFAPVALAQGMHRLTVTGRTGSNVKLKLLFGGPGAQSVGRNRFFHAR